MSSINMMHQQNHRTASAWRAPCSWPQTFNVAERQNAKRSYQAAPFPNQRPRQVHISVASRPHVETADFINQLGSMPHTQVQPVQTPLDWARQWYPVELIADLDPSRPHQVTVLGRDLVLWRDSQGDWRAFEDRCPHRLAPLSEGRIEEDGSLACSYHGWRFDSNGKCTAIPQALDERSEQVACSSSRSSVASYPVQVAEDLIWVWGSSGPEEFINAAAQPPLVTRELAEVDSTTHVYTVGKPYMRELPYDWQILVENFLDPAHVPFAHHGVQGNRYSETAGYLKMERSPDFEAAGVSFETRMRMFNPKKDTVTSIQFFAPAKVRYFTQYPGGFSVMNLFVHPVAPGRSRVFFKVITNVESKYAKMGERIPRWLDHVTRNSVFDGDNIFLHMLERTLDREGKEEGGSWSKSYFMPMQSDRIVIGFRKWLDANGGHPTWAPGVSPTLPPQERSREVLLNRYESHTKHCSSCMKALSVFRALQTAAVAGAGLLVLGLAAVLGRGVQPVSALPMGLLATVGLCALGWKFASSWAQKYIYVDYVHQEHK